MSVSIKDYKGTIIEKAFDIEKAGGNPNRGKDGKYTSGGGGGSKGKTDAYAEHVKTLSDAELAKHKRKVNEEGMKIITAEEARRKKAGEPYVTMDKRLPASKDRSLNGIMKQTGLSEGHAIVVHSTMKGIELEGKKPQQAFQDAAEAENYHGNRSDIVADRAKMAGALKQHYGIEVNHDYEKKTTEKPKTPKEHVESSLGSIGEHMANTTGIKHFEGLKFHITREKERSDGKGIDYSAESEPITDRNKLGLMASTVKSAKVSLEIQHNPKENKTTVWRHDLDYEHHGGGRNGHEIADSSGKRLYSSYDHKTNKWTHHTW